MKPANDKIIHPQAAIGFLAELNGSAETRTRSQAALQRALKHFENLGQRTLEIGRTSLTIWGRGNLQNCVHQLSDGSQLVLIGSPVGTLSWQAIEDELAAAARRRFVLPYEGRVVLLRIDPRANIWTLWNDWLGAIPVFHVTAPVSRIASTLEPVVVDGSGFDSSDLHLPALLALLIWGHYFSDWTLFEPMKVIPPDSESTWNHAGFCSKQLSSIEPSEERWLTGWDDLVDEMHQLSQEAIENALKESDRWILPLSGGLDSRLIAAVAAKIGKEIRTFTWGLPKSSDVIHARHVAQVLRLPWKYLDTGDTYLTGYREQWADMFGSAMHFHGMYQMPFLDALKRDEPDQMPIVSGYIGECLAGYATKFLCETSKGPTPYQVSANGYLHWRIPEIRELMSVPIDEALAELSAEYERRLSAISGPLYHRLHLLVLWGRQRYFTYFSSMMSDYWRGVTTPYMDRQYARFSFSLPRAVFDERVLQRAMFRRYYPELAAVPDSHSNLPEVATGSYLLKKRFSRYLPRSISSFIFPEFYRTNPNLDIQCVVRDGKNAFYPVFENLGLLSRWLNVEHIEETYDNILANRDGRAVRKLQSIQTLAYRLQSKRALGDR